jgi:hypothetical protein
MGKVHDISDIRFEKDFLILIADGQILKLKLSDISRKLANASDEERKYYKISPSGYGIHWEALDEDLSIDGLLKINKAKEFLPHHV